MNETKCEFCGGDMVWVGGLVDGRLECTTCAPLEDVAAAANTFSAPASMTAPTDYDLAMLTSALPEYVRNAILDGAARLVVTPSGAKVVPVEEWYMGRPTAGTPFPAPGCMCPACDATRRQMAAMAGKKFGCMGLRNGCQCPECKQIRAIQLQLPSQIIWSDE